MKPKILLKTRIKHLFIHMYLKFELIETFFMTLHLYLIC